MEQRVEEPHEKNKLEFKEESEILRRLGVNRDEMELLYPRTLMRCLSSMPKTLRKESNTPKNRAINKYNNLKYDKYVTTMRPALFPMFALGMVVVYVDFLINKRLSYGSYLGFAVTLTGLVLGFDLGSERQTVNTAIFRLFNSLGNDAEIDNSSPDVKNKML